jgi:hypothetical protein
MDEKGKKTLASLASGLLFLFADPKFYSHLASGYQHPCCKVFLRLRNGFAENLFMRACFL